MKHSLVFVIAFALGQSAYANESSHRFTTIVLSEEFHSEGASVADINRDGNNDIISGPFWYAGPDFRTKHAFAAVKPYTIKGYSDHFFSFPGDFDSDGWTDILTIAMPGTPAYWHRNPGSFEDAAEPTAWEKFLVLSDVGNESPTLVDIDRDGVDELICASGGKHGYAKPNPSDPMAPWTFIAISDRGGYGRFTHGLGVGDIDGDGQPELLEMDGWWKSTQHAGQPWDFHRFTFAQSGGSQIHAYDFDGDGDNDVVSSQNAHGYGLAWFENRSQNKGEPVFVRHEIMGNDASKHPYGLAISQLHALALADVDGDGVKDLVTGKRFWAHGGNDPGAQELPVLYWFRTERSAHGVNFVPMLIDRRVGVGTQLWASDVDGNGHVDIVVGNKLGTYVALNSGVSDAPPVMSQTPRHTAGTSEFRSGVRTTEPLTPEQELETFVLPDGFVAELVVAEPQIAKPMNMAFDSRNRLWVSSSNEYPYPAADGEGKDTIKVLEDTTGDGTYDLVTTFADNLNIPIGLYPYGDGVICFSIPNIYYLRDTDGDGKADKREVLYGPFDTSRDTHGMCNAFTRGYDGWLYACHGFNNQSSVAGKDGNVVTMHSGNTFRMRLDGSRIEHFTHGQVNPFGLAFDEDGNAFTADCHTKPVSFLMQGGYYPSFGKPHDGLGFVPQVMEHLNGSTAIGGMALYNGGQFPSVYQNSAFGGNVMTSRINRNAIVKSGGSIEAIEQSDFLISGDPWFRPVDLQIGPDGALYVADFYNRIIGHYEVPLDHPGRDRDRGRIWRIRYQPTETRRDVTSATTVEPAKGLAKHDDIDALIEQLASDELSARLIAADTIVDQFAEAAITQVRAAFSEPLNDHAKIHLAWVLHRLGALELSDVEKLIQSSESRVRQHGYQILSAIAGEQFDAASTELLQQGLVDPSNSVRRAVVMAMIQHPSQSFVKPLLDASVQVSGDPHLHHAIRMALRDHLGKKTWFESSVKDLSEAQTAEVLSLCLAIKTDFAGYYVAQNLDRISRQIPSELTAYLTFASRYCGDAELDSIVRLSRERFAADPDFQKELLLSIRSGRAQRGEPLSPVVKSWAIDLACQYLGIDSPSDELPNEQPPLPWSYRADPSAPSQVNPWQVSTQRNSSDGQQNSSLFSSFPKGEKLVGFYRSGSFPMPSQFSFFFAGHDGQPGKPLQQKNYVQICEAGTDQVIKRWSPLRNDTAQLVKWSSGEHAGKQVYVELVDTDTATAYAWIAVGRFSLESLNPSDIVQRREKAMSLLTEFKLGELEQAVCALLTADGISGTDRAVYAKALVSLSPSAVKEAAAEALSIENLDDEVRNSIVDSLLSDNRSSMNESLKHVMKVATSSMQSQIAEQLSSDRDGAAMLVDLIEQGAASARLLKVPSIEAKLSQLASDTLRDKIARLAKDLGSESPLVQEAISARQIDYREHGGDRSQGMAIFKTQCAICHKVAGQGAEVGPNLDGIGSRGLERILEDVIAPNRNVDAAFRTSVVLLDDGRVLSGLVKRSEGAQIILVDEKGKESAIAIDTIEAQQQNRNSPMPANFHEVLTAQQFNDLLAYLLSLTK